MGDHAFDTPSCSVSDQAEPQLGQIRPGEPSDPAALIWVKRERLARNAILVPGVGGDPSEVFPLAQRLRGFGGIAVADLQAMANSAPPGAVTVEHLAACVASAATAAGGRPTLIGYSFGGLVAYEAGRLLAGSDVGVNDLVMIDSAPEQSHWPRTVWLATVWRRLVFHLRSVLALSPSKALAELAVRSRGFVLRLRRRRASLRMSAGDTGKAAPEALSEDPATRLLGAHYAFQPQPLGRGLTIIESSHPPYGLAVSKLWRAMVPELEVLTYDGDHLGAVRSTNTLESLAAVLNTRLGLSHGADGQSDQSPKQKPDASADGQRRPRRPATA